jgi:hypothetical protein
MGWPGPAGAANASVSAAAASETGRDLDGARRMHAAAASRAGGYGGPADRLATARKNPGADMHHVLRG